MGCSGMTAVHAARLAGVTLGSVVVVNGVGGVGVAMVQVARAAGAEVIAIADSASKAALARAVGARTVIEADDAYSSVAEQLQVVSERASVDFYVDLVATTRSMSTGIAALGPSGCFVTVGYGRGTLVYDPLDLIDRELRIVSSSGGTRADVEAAISLAAVGMLRAEIDSRYSLSDLDHALELLATRSVRGRSVIVW